MWTDMTTADGEPELPLPGRGGPASAIVFCADCRRLAKPCRDHREATP